MAVQESKTVFVVDDDAAIRAYFGEVLSENGYRCLPFSDSMSALKYLASEQAPDLILSDIEMPGMSGLELLRTVKATTPELPFVLVSGMYNLSSALDALRVGATDILLKPALPVDILKVLSKNLHRQREPKHEMVRAALARFLDTRRLSGGDSAGHLFPLFDVLGFKHFETLQHSQRVASFALLIGTGMGLDRRSIDALEIGSLLHDIGKVGIPHNVLMKPGKLTEDEWTVMRMHPVIGWEMLADFPGMELEAQIVCSHHERFDGAGYPRRLAGEAIPIGARIFSVVDTLDAITSDRCYRRGRPIAAAREEIERVSRTQFDPQVVAQLRLLSDRDLEVIWDRHPD